MRLATPKTEIDSPLSLVSLDPAGSATLVRDLQGAGFPVMSALPWGVPSTYRELLDRRPHVVLFDLPRCPRPAWSADYIHALSLLGPVVALVPACVDVAACLEAAALDVVRRDAPLLEIVARLKVRVLRTPRLPNGQREPQAVEARATLTEGQRLLLDFLSQAPGRVGRRGLQLLLAPPGTRLTRRALHARVSRLSCALRPYGLSIQSSYATGYRLVRAERAGTRPETGGSLRATELAKEAG